MFARWLACYQLHSRYEQSVFVTASATLKEQVRALASAGSRGSACQCCSVRNSQRHSRGRDGAAELGTHTLAALPNPASPKPAAPLPLTHPRQVSRTFRKLQAAAVASADDAAAIAAAAAVERTSLRDVPPAAFPLFVTSQQWLRMLDASCDERFFGGGGEGGEDADPDGIGLHVDLRGWDSEEDEEAEAEAAAGAEERGGGEEGGRRGSGSGGGSSSGEEDGEDGGDEGGGAVLAGSSCRAMPGRFECRQVAGLRAPAPSRATAAPRRHLQTCHRNLQALHPRPARLRSPLRAAPRSVLRISLPMTCGRPWQRGWGRRSAHG
jgi:hypothetical protein